MMRFRRIRIVVWCCGMTAGLLVPCGIAAQPEPATGAQVDQLLRKLGRGTAAQRDAAETSLLEIGPEALPYLPPVEKTMPADFKVRLQRVTRALQNRAAEQVWQPATLTLQGEYEWPKLVEAIKRQTGNALRLEEAPLAPAQVDVQGQPFWPTLDRLLDNANADIDPYAGEPHQLVIAGRTVRAKSRHSGAVYAGPLRMEATSVDCSRDLIGNMPPLARVRLAVAWEPRLSPIAVSFPFQSFVAEDDNGRRYPCVNPDAHPAIPVRPGTSQVEISVPFEAPPREVAHWKNLQAQAEVLLLGDMIEFDFADLTKPAEQSKAGVRVSLEETRKNGDVWEVRVKIAYDDSFTGLDSHRGWVQNNPVAVKTADGKTIESLGLQLTSQDRRSLGIAFLFELPADLTQCTLHYETPAKILTKQLEFQLGRIALP